VSKRKGSPRRHLSSKQRGNKREGRGDGQSQRSSEVRQLSRRILGLSVAQRSERTDRTAELANFELEEKRRDSIDLPTENPSDKNQATLTYQSTSHKTRTNEKWSSLVLVDPREHASTDSIQPATKTTDHASTTHPP
jgi:hypothetical protein